MSKIITLGMIPLLYLLEIIYLQMAIKYRILPKHQDQSRRNRIITGAGIIFPIAFALYFALNDFVYPGFTIVLLFVSLFSLFHDVFLKPKQLLNVFLLMGLVVLFSNMQINMQVPVWVLVMCYFIALWIIFAVRALDGINGMLGMSGIVFIVSCMLVNPPSRIIDVSNPLFFLLASFIVFGIFNFRFKARAFAGSIGRTAFAFIIIFYLVQLVFGKASLIDHETMLQPSTTNMYPQYLLFMTVFLVDYTYTFINRIASKQNPFISQKDHLYHSLVISTNQKPIFISIGYALLQLVINLLVWFES